MTILSFNDIRVLHIAKYYPPFAGGIEHFVADLHISLCNKNVQSYVLAHQHPDIKQSTLKKNFDRTTLVPVVGNFLYSPISPLFPNYLIQYVQEIKPDIIHIHMPNVSAFWMLFFKITRKIPWVVHWHSDVVPSKIDKRMILAYQLYKPFEYKMLRHAKKIIATSRPYLSSSKTLSSFQDKCHVIPLGVSQFRFNSSNKKPITFWNNDKFKILSIGRLTYYKGYDTLIKAAKNLHNSQVIIVGDGDKREYFENMIFRIDVTNVNMIGFVEKDQIEQLLYSCDCLCLPSLERTEAFGLVLLEAMLFSKPVVASSLPGPSWIVEHEKTGLLVKPGDVKALVDALKLLMNSPKTRKQMGQASYDRFFDLFEIDQISNQIHDIYQDISK